MTMQKITFKEQVYNLIFSDVLEGKFPLDQFITEKQLMELYQVGKAPVREALIELCNENILHSIPRLGYQITPITEKNIIDATELRLDLELNALKKTQKIFSDQILSKITHLNQNWWQEAISEEINIKKRWQHNSLFHTTLCSFAGNELVTDVVRKLIRMEWQAYAQMLSTPEQREEFFSLSTIKPHIAIERALTERDFDMAYILLQQDITTLLNWLRSKNKASILI